MTSLIPAVIPRWREYVLERGQGLVEFWDYHTSTARRDVLFILGKGFDPRMCLGLEKLLPSLSRRNFNVLLLEFDEGPASPSHAYRSLIEANVRRLRELLPEKSDMRSAEIQMWSDDGRGRIGAHKAGLVFRRPDELAGYTDIVIDTSALPRGIFFPLVAKVLYLLDSLRDQATGTVVNLHLLVWEDIELDQNIRDAGINDSATYLHPFRAADRESSARTPRVWLPLLGEGQEAQLKLIDALIGPEKEICPVLPSPSRHLRRADEIVIEYQSLLFDGLRVEPGNFIYASEQNPFEVYRQVFSTIQRYRRTLAPLGPCIFVLSALSTKLFSVGALLTACDLKNQGLHVGIAHVECHGYRLEGDAKAQGDLFGMWLTGEYDAK